MGSGGSLIGLADSDGLKCRNDFTARECLGKNGRRLCLFENDV